MTGHRFKTALKVFLLGCFSLTTIYASKSDDDNLAMSQSIIFSSIPQSGLKPQASRYWPLMHDRLVLTLEPIADPFQKFYVIAEQLKNFFKSYMGNEQPFDVFLRYMGLLNAFQTIQNLDEFGINPFKKQPLDFELTQQVTQTQKVPQILGEKIKSEAFFQYIQSQLRHPSGKNLDVQTLALVKKTLELSGQNVFDFQPKIDPVKTLSLEDFLRQEINQVYGQNLQMNLHLWMAEEFNFYLIPAIQARRAFLQPDEPPTHILDLPKELFIFRDILVVEDLPVLVWEDISLRTSTVLVELLNTSEVDTSTRERMNCLLTFLKKLQQGKPENVQAESLFKEYLIRMQFCYGLTHDLMGQPKLLAIPCTKEGRMLHEVMAFEAHRLGALLIQKHEGFLNIHSLKTWFFLESELIQP